MEQTLEHRIRQRAYEIWHAHGQADGKADEYWLAAEREVLSSVRSPAPVAEASASAKSDKRVRAATRTGVQRATKSSKISAMAQSIS